MRRRVRCTSGASRITHSAKYRKKWILPLISGGNFCCFVKPTAALLLFCSAARATIFGHLRGVVHVPQHRPIAGAHAEIKAAHSTATTSMITSQDGSFSLAALPLGDYILTVSETGFSSERQTLTLASDTGPVLHFELQLGTIQQSVSVQDDSHTATADTVTPTTLISRDDISRTPGAYITHDMLHVRGGHQVSWLIDGVQIPNTNIASNLGAQIDPKDIDYIEVQRGSYTSDVGDRTYGVFNVVPRTGFERNRQAEIVLSAGSFLQPNDQLSFGDHTEKLAHYASLSGNRSDYGLSPPTGKVQIYTFGQHGRYLFGASFNDSSGTPAFSIPDSASGGVVVEHLFDDYQATSRLTLIAGLRQTRFVGQFAENAIILLAEEPRETSIIPKAVRNLLAPCAEGTSLRAAREKADSSFHSE